MKLIKKTKRILLCVAVIILVGCSQVPNGLPPQEPPCSTRALA